MKRPCVLCGEPRLGACTVCGVCLAAVRHERECLAEDPAIEMKRRAVAERRIQDYHDREAPLAAPTAS